MLLSALHMGGSDLMAKKTFKKASLSSTVNYPIFVIFFVLCIAQSIY